MLPDKLPKNPARTRWLKGQWYRRFSVQRLRHAKFQGGQLIYIPSIEETQAAILSEKRHAP